MALLNGGFDFKFGGRRGVKVVFGIGFEGWLITLQGEDVIGFVGDDFVGDLDLTAHGVDGHGSRSTHHKWTASNLNGEWVVISRTAAEDRRLVV